jgi:hypothetical protein
MRTRTLIVFLWIAAPVAAVDPPPHPGYPPTMLRGSAVEEKGKVVVQLYQPGPVTPADLPKVKSGDRYETEWVPLNKLTLGETVKAFGVDGKPIEPKKLVQALAKPKGVVVFLRSYANDPLVPPAFYRELLREATVILVAAPDQLYNPPPQ